MDIDYERKCHELEKKLTVLQNENLLLSDRAEETLLISLISESVRSVDNKDALIDDILERISILKKSHHLPSCSTKFFIAVAVMVVW